MSSFPDRRNICNVTEALPFIFQHFKILRIQRAILTFYMFLCNVSFKFFIKKTSLHHALIEFLLFFQKIYLMTFYFLNKKVLNTDLYRNRVDKDIIGNAINRFL